MSGGDMAGDIKSALDPNCMQTQRIAVFDSGVITTAAGGTASLTSSSPLYGKVVGIEVDTNTLAENAVISAYSKDTLLASPNYFLSYTVGASRARVFFVPGQKMTDNTGAALVDNFYAEYIIAGRIQIDIASGGDTKACRIRIFVEI